MRLGRENGTRSPFRYAIVANDVDPAIDRRDEARRFVEVLINKPAFSKENLTTLFWLVSKRFPKPNLLFIDVFISLDDVQTPEERDRGLTSGGASSSGPNLQDTAIFTRSGKKMSFIIAWADGGYLEVEMK